MEQLSLFNKADTQALISTPNIDEQERQRLTDEAEYTDDYEAFVRKFEAKKTTDDCYTPEEVYTEVLAYVMEHCPEVHGLKVLRPFYPGGDYRAVNYQGAVVIDNPPFSILAEIKRFYCEREIPFFLFAPSLTLFTGRSNRQTFIVAAVAITYANGAQVNTSFVSNMFGTARIILDGSLRHRIAEAQRRARAEAKTRTLPKYEYPKNVISSALLAKFVAGRPSYKVVIDQRECHRISYLDHQRAHNKSVFGDGYLISDDVVERLTQEQERAAKEETAPDVPTLWRLSHREQAIIRRLNEQSKAYHDTTKT